MGLLDRLFGRETDDTRSATDRYSTDRYSTDRYSSDRYSTDRYSSDRAATARAQQTASAARPAGAPSTQQLTDDQAVERYRYLLRTASPETVEQVHEEAFAALTPAQRQLVFDRLQAESPAGEAPTDASAASLARSATRSELRRPGFLERTLGGTGASGRSGPGFGTIVGGSLLGTVAGVVVGTAIADLVLPAVGEVATEAAAGFGDLSADISDAFGDFGDFGF